MDENKALDPELMEALKGVWNSLTDEQREKAMACKTTEELAALAAKEGVELSDEMLDAVAGGYVYDGTGPGSGYFERWYALDDKCQKYEITDTQAKAEKIAERRGWSTETISEAKLTWIQLKNCF